MRYIILLFIIFLFNSIIIPQESVLLKFGNGTSSLSDFSVQVQNGNESFQIDIKRLRSNLRDLNFQFDDTFNNEIVKLMLKLASASADGISIESRNNPYLPKIQIGKLSYSLKNWDLHFEEDEPKEDPVLSAKISLQQINLVSPRNYTNNLSNNTWDVLKLFYKNGSLLGKKVSIDFNLNIERSLNLKAQIDLPVGKAILKSKVSLSDNFQGNPYVENAEIDITGLTPGLREVIDSFLANSNKVPFKKKGTGYQLRFKGEINNPRFY